MKVKIVQKWIWKWLISIISNKQTSKQDGRWNMILWEVQSTHPGGSVNSHDSWRVTADDSGMLKNISATFHRFVLTFVVTYETVTFRKENHHYGRENMPFAQGLTKIGNDQFSIDLPKGFSWNEHLDSITCVTGSIVCRGKKNENHGMFTNMCIL